MWINVGLFFFFFLSLYLLVVLTIKLFRGKSLTDSNTLQKKEKTEEKDKVIKGVVIKAVKKRGDDLVNITKRYNLADSEALSNNQPDALESEEYFDALDDERQEVNNEQEQEFKIEATISDDSFISELEDPENIEAIDKMAEIMKNIASDSSNKVYNDEKSIDYSEFEDGIDDSEIAEFINTDFLKSLKDKKDM